MAKKPLNRVLRFLSSHRLAYVLFILLLILTFFGTIEQTEHGIFEVKEKYFNSIFLVHYISDSFPLPLPGGMLVISLLFLNLLTANFLKLKRTWSRLGILVTHLGVGLLIVSAFITFAFSYDGHLTLYETQESNKFKSYYEWEIVISEYLATGEIKDHIIPVKSLTDVSPGQSQEYGADNLPFTIKITQYFKNSRVLPKGPMFQVNVPVVDGYFIEELAPEKDAERNVPGLYLTLTEKKTTKSHTGILSGMRRYPWAVRVGGNSWTAALQAKTWDLPFTIVLDNFTRELHPRTGIAKVFMSDVTKIENGVAQQLKITMNEPLRHKGYTLYQASWGPENAKPGQPLFSTFSVVKNPADKIPEFACIVIGFGLFFHFGLKLLRYVALQNRTK